jgi:hypothetical protein
MMAKGYSWKDTMMISTQSEVTYLVNIYVILVYLVVRDRAQIHRHLVILH